MKRFELLLHYLAIGTLEPGAPCSVGTGHRLYVPSGASWHTLTKRRRALPSFTGGSAFLEVLWRRKLAPSPNRRSSLLPKDSVNPWLLPGSTRTQPESLARDPKSLTANPATQAYDVSAH